LHYGQAVFEGMKAYRTASGDVQLFRPANNIARLNNSNRRMCIPELDEEFCLKAIRELVNLERAWVPDKEGTSLYLRPFIFGTDEFLGVRPSDTYLFAVICSPCGSYYAGGMAPVKIYIETKYVRAVKGGVGEAKTEGNYAASLKAQKEASEKGYSQVLWLDGQERKYVEEVGAMNVFFVIGDTVVTPALEGSILPGITRLSAIEILKDKGYNVEERRISVDELIESSKKGELKEAFGTGTAAVVSPIGELCYNDVKYEISDGRIGKISQELYDELTGIQFGEIKDTRGWVVEV
jgi:branched-chain amino acid aminotransferase